MGAGTGGFVGRHGSQPLQFFFLHNFSHGRVSSRQLFLHFFFNVGSSVGTGSVGLNVTGDVVGLDETGDDTGGGVGAVGLLGSIVISAQFQNCSGQPVHLAPVGSRGYRHVEVSPPSQSGLGKG